MKTILEDNVNYLIGFAKYLTYTMKINLVLSRNSILRICEKLNTPYSSESFHVELLNENRFFSNVRRYYNSIFKSISM